jgi:GTP pyrophosphokinase
VAAILAELGMDLATVIAGLLHDVVEDTDISLETIEQHFGEEVAHLVDGVTKLHSVPAQPGSNGQQALTEAEYLRKTISAMTDDVRVILIKLADRLHNMRTLGSLSPHRQVAIAQETLDLFAPLANRLGIWRFKAELENLSFKYIEPASHRYIMQQLKTSEINVAPMRATLIETLEQAFEGHGLNAEIFPIKQYVYTVYTQMHARRIPVEETYGVRGIRILVDGKMDCYQALGILHQCWRPVPERFIDYVATPKDKFYQSLHTAVFYEDGLPFDVQIRTHEMDYQANYGIVAYLRYHNEPPELSQELDRRMDYLKQLIEPAEVEETPERFVQSVIENIDSDRIYVMTPKGDMLDLPRGSTPIDFAYHVHRSARRRRSRATSPPPPSPSEPAQSSMAATRSDRTSNRRARMADRNLSQARRGLAPALRLTC